MSGRLKEIKRIKIEKDKIYRELISHEITVRPLWHPIIDKRLKLDDNLQKILKYIRLKVDNE